MNNENRMELMTNKLQDALQPEHLEIIDDSHLHAGHVGAKSGKGHFTVIIKSALFKKLSVLKQHQLVYQAMGELMQTDIHALVIKTSS